MIQLSQVSLLNDAVHVVAVRTIHSLQIFLDRDLCCSSPYGSVWHRTGLLRNRAGFPVRASCRSGTVDGASHIRSVPSRSSGTESLRESIARRPESSPAGQAQARCRHAGRAVLQRFQQKSEPPLRLFFTEPERRKHLGLNIAPMNTNRARPQFDAIQHQVVRLRAAMRRICRQLSRSSSWTDVNG